MNQYQIILSDPPWTYRDKCQAGERGVEFKYHTMTVDEIASLSVPDICAPDCALFMWATWPLLPNALHVIERWGFEYKTVAFVWTKLNRKAPTLFWGMGNWTRANTEICLLGVRGALQRVGRGVHQVIAAPIGKHSQKPAEARDRIVQLLGPLPRIELFARERVDGWAAWGNEIKSPDVKLEYRLSQPTLFESCLNQ